MKRRNINMRKKLLSLFLAAILCLFAFAGCESAGETSSETLVSGAYLGRNIDECYEAWGITPVEDILFVVGSREMHVFLNDPVDYLGEKFFIRLTYPTGAEGRFYNDRLDSVTYVRNYHKVSDEEVAKEAALLFEKIREEYGAVGEAVGVYVSGTDRFGDPTASGSGDESALTEENITEWMKAFRATGDVSLGVTDVLKWEWHLPEEYKKLDPDVVKLMEENVGESMYRIECSLEFVEGQYSFFVKHVYSAL